MEKYMITEKRVDLLQKKGQLPVTWTLLQSRGISRYWKII